jgi:hypothetical protein
LRANVDGANDEKVGEVLLSNSHPTVFVPHSLYKDMVIMLESHDPKFKKSSSFIFRRLVNVLIYDPQVWHKLTGTKAYERFSVQVQAILGNFC